MQSGATDFQPFPPMFHEKGNVGGQLGDIRARGSPTRPPQASEAYNEYTEENIWRICQLGDGLEPVFHTQESEGGQPDCLEPERPRFPLCCQGHQVRGCGK